MLLTEGQASDYWGAALLRNALPPPKERIADKGHDGNGFRNALAERGIAACIPSKSSRKIAIPTPPSSTASAARSKTCSVVSKTGTASTPVTTAAHTPSSQPSASQPPPSFGLVNEF